MGAVLKLIDEHFGKGREAPFELRLVSETVTARELIAARISEEIDLLDEHAKEMHHKHNRTRSFLIRFDPDSLEAKLNGKLSRKPPKKFDKVSEIKAAEQAFLENKFVMLFDEKQIEHLDETISVTSQSEVVFLRLVPLVGG
ncbi:MAG: hypothetical protein AAGB16_07955 [Pseudomonadota bacterium]